MGIRDDGELYDYVYPYVKNKLIFDIGSNIGEVTKKFITNADSKVVAVEPQCDLTNHKNYSGVFSIKHVCISDKVGDVTFYRAHKSNSVSTCFLEWKNRHPSIKYTKKIVPAITLDDLIVEFGVPVYIKIDVEGYEHKVLEGLSHKVDLISFEFTQGYWETFYGAIKKIEKLGFKKMITFQKKKIKGTVNGRRRTIESYKIVDEFYDVVSVVKFFKNLPNTMQGDILIEA